MSFRTSSLTKLALIAATAIPVLLTTGCGLGTPAAAPETALAGLSGIAHGGPNGDAFATVKLYATATAAYGTASTLLATTTTDQFGFFSFGTSAATCTANQQSYITVTGGNTGANTNNPQVLLMAALGPCSGISKNTSIYINELTTIAAGYALSNFIGINGTTVNVSAPATNNATAPSCAGTGTSMVCTAGGLSHAFLNALNLVNAVSPTGTTSPSGQAYTTVPGNANSTVPTLLINTLGDILQACVNSVGGVAGDGSNCGTLFTNTTPPSTSAASPVTPTNTLQAVLNLAKYPTMAPGQITALYALSAPQTYFSPALAAAPVDFSMAVAYMGPVPTAAFYGFFTVADITDSTYTIAETGNGSGPVTVSGLTSNGTQSYQSPTIAGALCTAGSPCAAGVDSVGHLWLANTASTNLNVYEIGTAAGALVNTFAFATGTAPNSAAVDKFNDVFVTSANVATNDLFEFTPGSTAFAAVTAGGTAETQSVASPEYITVDGSGNLWNTNYNSSNLTITYNQNTAAASVTPAYGNPYVADQLVSAAPGVPYTIMIDGSGNAWVNNTLTLFKVPAGAGAPSATYTITGIGGGSTTAAAAVSARFSTLDGDGNIFLPDNSKNAVWQYLPGTTKFIFMIPCTGNTGTACITAGQRIAASRNALTDSTGSIWVSDPSATVGNGNVIQIIGTGAPTWPQMSYGKPGVRP